jgi:K+/H+ antiporter YhaU regulatory subunit KhtT
MPLSFKSLSSQINYAKKTLKKIGDLNMRKAYHDRVVALEKELKR